MGEKKSVGVRQPGVKLGQRRFFQMFLKRFIIIMSIIYGITKSEPKF